VLSHLFSEDIIVKNIENPDMLFILGCLNAAGASVGKTRQKVLLEAANHLGCTPRALAFLFETQTSMETGNSGDSDNSVYDFPDSHRRRRAHLTYARYAAE